MYKIKKVSELTNLSISTLRYYEELNLLTPSRTKNNYREYSEKDLEWLFFIKRIKETGMSLKDIQIYSELRNTGDSTIAQRIDMLNLQEKKLQEQIDELQEDINFIKDKKETYRKLEMNEKK